jgi:hypothetical protein
MNGLLSFMNGGIGRIVRIALGSLLVYVGLVPMGGSIAGYIVAAIGLLPIVMGLWGHCVLEFVMPKAK